MRWTKCVKRFEGLAQVNGLEVVYEDNHVLLVVKPAGLPTQASRAGEDCLVDRVKLGLKQRDQKLGEVYLGLLHRLDQPVSGLVLLAKTSKAAARLTASLQAGEWKKLYLAVSQGERDAEERAFLEHYLLKSARQNRTLAYTAKENPPKGAKYAALRYHCLAQIEDRAYLAIELFTGRSHQIRSQLSKVGLPLYADHRYHPNWNGQAKGGGERADIALLAAALCFPHPTKKEDLAFLLYPSEKGVWAPFGALDIEAKLWQLMEKK